MLRHHQGQRHRSTSLSGIDVNSDGAAVSSPTAASTLAAASASLRVGYTYPLVAYLNSFLGGIRYPCCFLGVTAESMLEAEAAAASASSDLEKKFSLHSNEIGKV